MGGCSLLDDIDQFQDQQYDCDNDKDMNPASCPGNTGNKSGAECAEQPENQQDGDNSPHNDDVPFPLFLFTGTRLLFVYDE